jgi:hypothetical protein
LRTDRKFEEEEEAVGVIWDMEVIGNNHQFEFGGKTVDVVA